MLYRPNFSLAMIKFLLLQNKPSVVAVYLSNLAPRLNDNTGLQILCTKNCFTCDTFFNSDFCAAFKNAIHFKPSHQDNFLQDDQILRNFEAHS